MDIYQAQKNMIDEIRVLGQSETVQLIDRLSVLALRLFSMLRVAPSDALMDAACDLADLPHWMRKLGALSCLKNFRNERILQICERELGNPKREVRDAAALCLSRQDVRHVDFEVFDVYERNEGLAVFCGYLLQYAGYRSDAAAALERSLAYECASKTEQDYVRWYACRAAARAFSAISNENLTWYAPIYAKARALLASDDQKTRKAAAEAVGYYIAQTSDLDREIVELIEQLEPNATFEPKTHGTLQAICNAVLIARNTHDFFCLAQPRVLLEATILRIDDLYRQLPVELSEQPGSYHNALVRATLPTDQEILRLLSGGHPACLDAAISAAIYMQKYYYTDMKQLHVALKALTSHQSKPISVLAERALRMSSEDLGSISYSQMAEFAIDKMRNDAPDVREYAVRFVIWWFENAEQCDEDCSALKAAIVECAKNDIGGSLSQMPRKSAYECLEYIAKYVDCSDLEVDCLEELRRRTPFATSPVRFLAKESPRGLACCVINAFDAVCCDISDACRQCVALVNSQTLSQESVIDEIDELLRNEAYMAVSGIARLCFALRHAGVCVDQLVNILPRVREECENEWFDELFQTHDAYAAAQNGELEPDMPADFFAPCEFDSDPAVSAAFLEYAYSKGVEFAVEDAECQSELAKAVLKQKYDPQCVADMLLSSDVAPELKEKICCGICGSGALLPQKSEFDVKHTEDVVKK